MLIRVTEEHIENGSAGCSHCPVALAIQDAGYPEAAVFYQTAWLDGPGDVQVKLPEEATMFIFAFDNDRPLQPFEFDLPIPQP